MLAVTTEEMIGAIEPHLPDYFPCDDSQMAIANVDIVTITAPRGMGKDTVREETGYPIVKAFTTRERRPGEFDEYDFVESDLYSGLVVAVRNRTPIQVTQPFKGGHIYGTMSSAYPDEGPAILDVVPNQVEAIRRLPFRSVTNTYLSAKNYEIWRSRWAGRGPMTDDQVRTSLLEAEESLEWGLDNPDVTFVLNDTKEQAAKDIRTIVEKPGRYTQRKELQARSSAAGILRALKVDLGGRPLVV